tara:strand:- start:622 stop:783 length:162 start_codon:yes stop_codon:yes gene_type:complete
MDKETNEDIKKQIEDLQAALVLLKLVDNSGKSEIQSLQQTLDKLYDKISKDEN